MQKFTTEELTNQFNNKYISNHIKNFKRILKKFYKNNGISMIYGGAVRDALLGLKFDDIDIKTTLSESELLDMFPNLSKRMTMDDKMAVYYGRINRIFAEITHFDDVNEVNPNKLIESQKITDLTINNLYFDGEFLYDKETGVEDLKNKKLRTINEQGFIKNIKERPMLLLKTIRLIAKTGFEPDEKLIEIIGNHLDDFDNINSSIFISEGYKNIFYNYFPLMLKHMNNMQLIQADTSNLISSSLIPNKLQNKEEVVLFNYWMLLLGSDVIFDYMKFFKIPTVVIEKTMKLRNLYIKKVPLIKQKKFQIKSKEDMQVFSLYHFMK